MKEGHSRIPYRSMQDHSRLNIAARPFYDELCYTEEELQFRQRVINLRTASKIDAQLLSTEDSWFNEDKTQAFSAVNEGSWLLSVQYRPRHELSLDDFHAEILPPQRVSWTGLSMMMRQIGDYLLIRNDALSKAHLNQPFNYVLLDSMQILRKLAAINDAEYVSEQLQLFTQYLRAVEVMTSPMAGSDRLFLADCRSAIEKDIQFDIQQKLQSRQFKIKIERLHHELTNLAQKRHTGMHFAVTAYDANPHPFWELYKDAQTIGSQREFPTLAAKHCALIVSETTELAPESVSTIAAPESIRLTAEDLKQCPGFKFIDNLPSTVHEAYGQAISDLQEVLRFQNILEQLSQLLDQAGEVFTITQFRSQMLDLFEGIELFVQRSQAPVMEVLEANSAAYHQSIQDKQDIRWWEKWISDKPEKIDSFINNQDNLSRFGVTPVNLQQVEKQIMEQTNQIKTHLHQFATEEKQLELISSAKELMGQVMSSMQSWVNQQNRLAGLPEKPLNQAITRSYPKPHSLSETKTQEPAKKNRSPVKEKTIAKRPERSRFFKSTPEPLNQMFISPVKNSHRALPAYSPPPITASSNETTNQQAATINPLIFFSILILLPLGIILLKLLYDRYWANVSILSAPREVNLLQYEENLVKAEDSLALIAGYVSASGDEEQETLLEEFSDTVSRLKSRQKAMRYDQNALDSLLEELNDFIQDHHLANSRPKP
ncbi:hypothetical protein [Legionella quinlivanii]|uniref:hypothetical protein n=1 Tax=Legionella quinlivanii TaxID=45073 RepID=UPI0022430034|nr:hypothetical protein [Legionella quinlivanii]MCW8452277.1 hypothetical protein [Legionella quinlivanii]